jgi:hypothetical protein
LYLEGLQERNDLVDLLIGGRKLLLVIFDFKEVGDEDRKWISHSHTLVVTSCEQDHDLGFPLKDWKLLTSRVTARKSSMEFN